ncbi:hypothetical protein [Candidatus Leptofilum sp.]|uniref:hypothetical protein n=1 Tax=Candidatus Leptofilum sp. TaxID=3241576 RepID=UPI003B5CE766
MEEWENRKRSIFRAEAVQHYVQSQQESVIPKFVSPYAFPYFWMLICLLITTLCLMWLVRIPIFVSGQAVIVEAPGTSLPESAVLVIFFPPQYLTQLQEGQAVYIQSALNDVPIQQTIIAISPDVVSPTVATAVYGVDAELVAGPTAVALADFNLPEQSSYPTDTFLGSRYFAQVEVDSRRLISLFP